MAWAERLTELLVELPSNLLCEVLNGSDPSAFKRALEHLELLDRWRELRRDRTPRQSVASISGELSRSLAMHEHRCIVPGLLVFTWWGRSARRRFDQTSLSRVLANQPLMYGLEAAATQARRAGLPEDAANVQYALRKSDVVLDRVFAGLLDAAVDGAGEADLAAELHACLESLTARSNDPARQRVGPQTDVIGEPSGFAPGDERNPDFRARFKETLKEFKEELGTRRRFSVEDRVRIVLEGLRNRRSIAAVCRRERIDPHIYQQWLDAFLDAGRSRLREDQLGNTASPRTVDLRSENARLKEVIAEMLLENRALRERLSDASDDDPDD